MEIEFDMKKDEYYKQQIRKMNIYKIQSLLRWILLVGLIIGFVVLATSFSKPKKVIGYLKIEDYCEVTEWDMFTSKLFAISSKINTKYKLSENDNTVYDWLRNIIYKESKYNHKAKNKVSGAFGLIQWMPQFYNTPKCKMDQLDEVYNYFDYWLSRRYVDNRIDMYLCVLYPKTVRKTKLHSKTNEIFKSPSLAYKQNKGLDKNLDGYVSRYEIGRFLKK